ncbi:multidrug effflux MFS transporter [Escherichia coli]|nr:multidrug effflux MFS transporter [Escherichia coli]
MARVSLSWALILGLLAGIGPMCTDLYLPALPEMSEQLAATTTITQLTLTASLIGLGVGQLLFGPLSDKIGRKRPLILSLLLFIVSSILCATTNNIYWLVVWRFIQGIAGAGGSVLSRSIARDKYQGVTLTQFFALLMTVNGLAPVLSPVLGGYIVSTFDWRTLFWVMAEISTVLLLGCLLFINETLPENKRGSSLLLTGRSVLQKEFGFSPMQFSLVFGLNGIGLIIASWIFSRLARRINAMILLRGGLIAAILCALLTVLCAWVQLPIPALVALFFTIAFCSGIGTVGGAEAMSAVGTQESGTASALMGMSMFVFGGIAAPLSGIGGETLLKMSLAITVCYTLALLVALTRIDNQK